MATVIDALLVTLGLDATQFIKKQRETADTFKKTAESHVKQAKEMEAGFKGVSASLAAAAVSLAAFFVALAAKKAKDFIVPLTDTELKFGQTAKAIGMSANALGAWDLILKRVGGKKGEAASTLQALRDAFEEMKIHGESANTEPFFQAARFGGHNFNPASPFAEQMRVLAANIATVAKTQPELAHTLGMNATHSEAMTQAFMESGLELDKIIKDAEKLVGLSEEDIEAAKRRTRAWVDLSAALDKFFEKMSTRLTPLLLWMNGIFLKLTQWATDFFTHLKGLSTSWLTDTSDVVNFVVSVFSGTAGDIRKSWSTMWDDLTNRMKAWIEEIKQAGPYLLTAFQAAFGAVYDWIKGRFNAIFGAVGMTPPFSDAPGGGGAEGGQPGRGEYNVKKAFDLIKAAGGTDEEARTLAAIAQPESGGNPRAHNMNVATGDNSYGLWQINMLGGMGPERRAKYGLKSNEDLFDPAINARVALAMHRAKGGYSDWSTYSSGAYRTYLGRAPGPQSSLSIPSANQLAALSAPGVSANYHEAMASSSSFDIDTNISEVNLHGSNSPGQEPITRSAQDVLARKKFALQANYSLT